MKATVHKRDYDIFLSHASEDKELVDYLDNWLSEFAGFQVWYSPRELSGGSLLATDLQKAISRCRGIVLVVTENSIKKGWVLSEYNAAMDEKNNNPDFRVVALRIKNANVDSLIKGMTWIDIASDTLSPENAIAIINSFYPGDKRPNPKNSKDVYVSCSWRQNDNKSANAIIKKMIDSGFRLIGDSEDQDAFGTGNRVERIISSCGAFVSILPFRDVEEARRHENPYKYLLKEIDYALGLNIPTIIISDPKILTIDGEPNKWLPMETNSLEISDRIMNALENLRHEWKSPINPQYIFCALDLDNEAKSSTNYFRHLVERITGMKSIIGTDITSEPIQSSIIDSIKHSFLTIADITDDNLNTCIEAGIAVSSDANVVLISKGIQRRPPFMLRSLQLNSFETEVQKIGLTHKIVWPYRRRIINTEF
jgi:hypothetical protein